MVQSNCFPMQEIAQRLKQKIEFINERFSRLGEKIDTRLNPTESIQIVQGIEKRLGIELPVEYVWFITEFANGGFGPGTGMFNLEESIRIFESFAYDTGRLDCRMSNAFPIDDESDWMRMAVLEVPLRHNFPVDGIFPLCEWENGGFDVLIVSGKYKGNVCFVYPLENGEGHWLPTESFGEGKFLNWYDSWLTNYIPESGQNEYPPSNRTKLKVVKAGMRFGNKSIDRGPFLKLFQLLPDGVNHFLSSVDAVLGAKLDRTEINRLLDDIKNDCVGLEGYVFYKGGLGEIFARTDPWGSELFIDLYAQPGVPGCTKDRKTIHEQITDLAVAFADAYLFNMDDESDSAFLYQVKTADILDWTSDKPQKK